MKINRRDLMATSLAGVALSGLPILSFARAADGFLEIVAAPSEKVLYEKAPGPSQLWTYNGTAPGPEIRVKKGQRVKVRLINKLEEPTTIHWHGIRIDNAMDGIPGLTQPPVMPGETFEYDFVAPDAGTFWYHSHDKTWNQVGRGMYGVLIVEETIAVFDREHDLTLVVDDWRLDQQGMLDTASFGSMMDWSHGGRLGNWMTVNGESLPRFDLKSGEAYRMRFLNVCNSRVLAIDPRRFNAQILAYDGQALADPVKLEQGPYLIGPGQRVDFLVIAEKDLPLAEVSGREPYVFAQFAVSQGSESGGEIGQLPQNDLAEPDLENARTFTLNMTGGAMAPLGDATYKGKKLDRGSFRETQQFWAFNGVANLDEKPFFAVKKGETVIIETVNRTAFSHAMHTHGYHFRIIERSGGDIEGNKAWRDTFMIDPDETVKIAFVADNPGDWLYHCHMLEHAAAGMITWFKVG